MFFLADTCLFICVNVYAGASLHCPAVHSCQKAEGFYTVCCTPGIMRTYAVVHEEGVCSVCDVQRKYCVHKNALQAAGKLVHAVGAGTDRCTEARTTKQDHIVSSVLDIASGQRKLTCISRMSLPASPCDDPLIHKAYLRLTTASEVIPKVCGSVMTDEYIVAVLGFE